MSAPGSIAYHRDLTPFEERLIEENRALRDHAGGEPYATRLWREVERLRAQVQAVEGVAAWYEREARLSESSWVAGFYRAAADNVRAALAVPAATEESTP